MDFLLFVLFVIISIGMISGVFLVTLSSFVGISDSSLYVFISIINVLAFILLVAGAIRRFHDIEMSGFWFFALLIPLIGIVFYLILLFKKGTTKISKYGDMNVGGNFLKRVLNLQ